VFIETLSYNNMGYREREKERNKERKKEKRKKVRS
jgi:hypothetical protein